MLHLSPATRILKENPTVPRSLLASDWMKQIFNPQEALPRLR